MYKLTVINNKFRLFSKREEVKVFGNKKDLLEAVDKVEKENKSYYITNENDKVIDINELRNNKPKEEVYTKSLDVVLNDVKLTVELTENKFSHEIHSKLIIYDEDAFYMNCMLDNRIFSKLELYDYFTKHMKDIKNLELAYMVMELIFHQ